MVFDYGTAAVDCQGGRVIVSDLAATVTIGSFPAPGLAATVLVASDPPIGLPAAVDLDLSVPQALRGEIKQIVGFRVSLDGEVIPPHLILSVQGAGLSMDNLTHSVTVETPIPSPFGSPAAFNGAPPGLGRVDIDGLYLTPTGEHVVRLLSGCIADTASLSRDAEGRRVGRYQFLSSGARHDRIAAEVNLPPGHGLPRDRVVSKVANAAGWTAQNLAPCGRMDKEFVIGGGESWTSACLELQATDGRLLTEDSFGNLANPVDGYNPGRPVDMVLRLTDLKAEVGVDVPGDILTRITVTGTQQITREGSARRTVITETISKSDYAPRAGVLQQGGGGAVSSSGVTQEPASLRVTGRALTIQEYDGDTWLSEQIYTYAYYNPLAVRYRVLDTAGTIGWEVGVYLYEGEANDDSMAYRWPVERLVLTGYAETRRLFDDDGFLVTSITRKDAPLFIQAALLSRPGTGTGWDEAGWINPRLLLGNRAGVRNGSTADPAAYTERMPRETPNNPYAVLSPGQETEVERTDYDNIKTETDAGLVGWVKRQTVSRSRYFAPEGSLYQYAGEDGKSIEWERLALYEQETTDFLPEQGDGSHAEIRTLTRSGKIIDQQIAHGLDGYLPAAERSLDLVAPADAFDNPADAANAVAASRFEAAPISGEAISYTLEQDHPRNETTVSAQYAESPAECQAIGEREVREGAAWQITIALAAANFMPRPGWRIQTPGIADLMDDTKTPADLADVYLRDVGWPTGENGTITTELGGRYYPV